MTIGPAPMIRIEEMSVRLGILLFHYLAFPSVVFAVELIRPRLHLLRVGCETFLVDCDRGFEHDAVTIYGVAHLVSGLGRGCSQSFEVAAIEVEQRVARCLPAVTLISQDGTDLLILIEIAHAQ